MTIAPVSCEKEQSPIMVYKHRCCHSSTILIAMSICFTVRKVLQMYFLPCTCYMPVYFYLLNFKTLKICDNLQTCSGVF